jgi:hypothetical protein
MTPIPFLKSAVGKTSYPSCGDDIDGRKADDWLQGIGFPSVQSELKRGTRVWVYHNSADEPIGFGSLGVASWKFDAQVTPVQFLPMLGVFKPFQGKPLPNFGSGKYCEQIIDHLLDEATQSLHVSRWVGLSVRFANGKAVHLYEKAGFQWLKSEKGLSRMLLQLP